MAFKMTPGMKGSPTSNSIMGGGCGGANQPPCPPRFSAEKDIVQRVSDRKISDRSARKAAKKVVAAPAPAPVPVKFQINLPKGYEFKSKMEKAAFYEKFSDLSGFKSQEQLDKAITAQLLGGYGPKEPEGPIFEGPIKEGPILEAPIKGGGEFEAAPVKKANVAVAK